MTWHTIMLPMLDIDKQEIIEWCKTNNINYEVYPSVMHPVSFEPMCRWRVEGAKAATAFKLRWCR